MEEKMSEILKRIPKIEPGKRIIVGIDGLSRSGKTTISTRLKEVFLETQVPVHLFHLDDFIVDRKRRYHTGHEEWFEYYQLQWDVQWLKGNFFEKLKQAQELQLPHYVPGEDKIRVEKVGIPETCVILVEGVFLQRLEWRGSYDFLLYIDSPKEKRFNRESELTQKNLEKFSRRYWKAEDYYLETIEPMHLADAVVQN